MVALGRLAPGDRLAVAPFRGVPYEAPSEVVIVSEADVTARLASLGKGERGGVTGQIVRGLRSAVYCRCAILPQRCLTYARYLVSY